MIDLARNHFELFGLPPRFVLDPDAMARAYREIQSRVHPDRFTQASEAERRMAMQWATHVNEAYATLREPLRRARYLLALRGVDAEVETNTSMPRDFLIAQMEWREALGDARGGGELDALSSRLRAESQALYGDLERALDAGDDAAAAGAVRKLMFFARLREELDEAIAEAED